MYMKNTDKFKVKKIATSLFLNIRLSFLKISDSQISLYELLIFQNLEGPCLQTLTFLKIFRVYRYRPYRYLPYWVYATSTSEDDFR